MTQNPRVTTAQTTQSFTVHGVRSPSGTTMIVEIEVTLRDGDVVDVRPRCGGELPATSSLALRALAHVARDSSSVYRWLGRLGLQPTPKEVQSG